MPPPSPLALYDYLSEHGPKGLREVAKDRFGGDVIEARQQLSYLEGQDLIDQEPPIHSFPAVEGRPRRWKVIDAK